MEQAGVHLEPVAADVQSNQELPQEDPQRVEVAQAEDEAGCGTAVCHHVQHCAKRRAWKKRKKNPKCND